MPCLCHILYVYVTSLVFVCWCKRPPWNIATLTCFFFSSFYLYDLLFLTFHLCFNGLHCLLYWHRTGDWPPLFPLSSPFEAFWKGWVWLKTSSIIFKLSKVFLWLFVDHECWRRQWRDGENTLFGLPHSSLPLR